MTTLRRAIVLLPFFAVTVAAQGDTTKGVHLGLAYSLGQRPGLAVLPVPGNNGDSVRAIMQRDLEHGDRVTIVGRVADELPLVAGVPNYVAFAQMNVAAILQVQVMASGELHVALHQTSEKRVVQARNFSLDASALSADWRMAVHRAADSVELWATGVAGISATRIAFVRSNRVWLVDSDGANAAAVEGTSDARSPAWHPSGRYLGYAMMAGSDAGGISVRDLWSGTSKRVTPSYKSGTFSAPAFTPDGSMLAYAYGEEGSEIWTVDPFKPGAPKKITVGRSGVINTSPTFSPDGRQISFLSARLGHPEVYIADVDGSNVRPLTDAGFTDETEHTNPAWSPDGRAIAYQSRNDGRFQIMSVSPSGKNVSALTSDSENEDPSWAPDGQHLVFSSLRSGAQQLWILDTASGTLRQLTFGSGGAKYSAWSPPLPRR
jgi:TolB protein